MLVLDLDVFEFNWLCLNNNRNPCTITHFHIFVFWIEEKSNKKGNIYEYDNGDKRQSKSIDGDNEWEQTEWEKSVCEENTNVSSMHAQHMYVYLYTFFVLSLCFRTFTLRSSCQFKCENLRFALCSDQNNTVKTKKETYTDKERDRNRECQKSSSFFVKDVLSARYCFKVESYLHFSTK